VFGKSSPPPPPGRTSVECPHCGFKQLESPHAKSTFCRRCGEHYELGKAPAESNEKAPSVFSRFGELFARNKTQEITCFNCREPQTVSSSATSTQCPHCSTYIDLTNYKIKSAVSRSIETQGVVQVTSRGELTGAKVLCRIAEIQGNIRGKLYCSQEARVKIRGKISGAFDVRHLVIERRSEVEFTRPIRARTAEITGYLKGFLEVDGTVTVTRKGTLEGTVYARALNVEKGGVFRGELIIGKRPGSRTDEDGESPEPPQEPAISDSGPDLDGEGPLMRLKHA